jgi:hypothetical protein
MTGLNIKRSGDHWFFRTKDIMTYCQSITFSLYYGTCQIEGVEVSDARPYKPWAGMRHRMVTQDLACNHTMAEISGANVEQQNLSSSS